MEGATHVTLPTQLATPHLRNTNDNNLDVPVQNKSKIEYPGVNVPSRCACSRLVVHIVV